MCCSVFPAAETAPGAVSHGAGPPARLLPRQGHALPAVSVPEALGHPGPGRTHHTSLQRRSSNISDFETGRCGSLLMVVTATESTNPMCACVSESILSALRSPKRRRTLNKLRGQLMAELLPLGCTLQTLAALQVDANHKVSKAACKCLCRAAGVQTFRNEVEPCVYLGPVLLNHFSQQCGQSGVTHGI